MEDNGTIRVSKTGATRDSAVGKIQPVKYFSPRVMRVRSEYMLKHSVQRDGSVRAGDNWQKGFGQTPKETKDICEDSAGRHFLDMWLEHRGFESRDGIVEAICGLMFNCEAYLEAYCVEHNIKTDDDIKNMFKDRGEV